MAFWEGINVRVTKIFLHILQGKIAKLDSWSNLLPFYMYIFVNRLILCHIMIKIPRVFYSFTEQKMTYEAFLNYNLCH